MVLDITMNGVPATYAGCETFALMYGRANRAFYPFIKDYFFILVIFVPCRPSPAISPS
jgi:uncharacterized membrane protein (DUF106 family)